MYKSIPKLPVQSTGLRPIARPKCVFKKLLQCKASYRWSAEGDGRRKRETLIDNVEVASEQNEEEKTSESTLAQRRRLRKERRSMRSETNSRQSPSSSYPRSTVAWDASEWGPAPPKPPEDEEYGWAQESWAQTTENTPDGWNYQPKRRQNKNTAMNENNNNNNNNGTSSTRRLNSMMQDIEDQDQTIRRRTYTPKNTYNGTTTSDSTSYTRPSPPEYEQDDDQDDNTTSSTTTTTIPDIALLSPQELDRVLPVVPFSAQATYFNGGAAQAVQRWAASLALTIVLSKAAVLAASSLTWPLWWPWAQAASKNYSMRKYAGYAGLWRTRVLEVEARGRPRPHFASRRRPGEDEDDSETENEDDLNSGSKRRSTSASRFSTMRTTRIVLGDVDGAQTELILPHDARFDLIAPGQPAELIVLSSSQSFESFKAVKDVYLPDCGLWLTEYPFLDRTEFLEISLEIEREANSSMNNNTMNYGSDDDENDAAVNDGYNDDEAYENDYDNNDYDDGYVPPPPRWR